MPVKIDSRLKWRINGRGVKKLVNCFEFLNVSAKMITWYHFYVHLLEIHALQWNHFWNLIRLTSAVALWSFQKHSRKLHSMEILLTCFGRAEAENSWTTSWGRGHSTSSKQVAGFKRIVLLGSRFWSLRLVSRFWRLTRRANYNVCLVLDVTGLEREEI